LFSLSAPLQVDLFTTNSTDYGVGTSLTDELTDLSTGDVLLQDSDVGDGLTSLLLQT
jgi:hypothetical protein